MSTWTGSPINVEEAFNQVWKSTVQVQPSFYFPLNSGSILPSPPITSSDASDQSTSRDDDLATAEILARIKFGSSSPYDETSSRKRSITSLMGDEEEEKDKPIIKRKKESSVESIISGGTSTANGGAAERWPPRKEFVYLTCVVAIPPVGRQKLPLFGKPCGRNEIIAKVVTLATGEGCSRKLISSHAQVLKGRKELSKQLRDLLTTEEGKNNEDEAAPTVYTLGADWNFPNCLNRIIGLPETLDLRTASPPPLITLHFPEPSKPIKPVVKKERAAIGNKNKLTIKTRPSKSLSPSIFSPTTSVSTVGKTDDQNVYLPTPKSSHIPSPYISNAMTPSHQSSNIYPEDYGYDHHCTNNEKDRRPSLPSPNDLFSPSYGMSTPRIVSEYASPTNVPRRPATANSLSIRPIRHLPPPKSPMGERIIIDSPYRTPLTSSRRTSDPHLTASLGRSYTVFERECLKSMGNSIPRVSGVSIEEIRRKESSSMLC